METALFHQKRTDFALGQTWVPILIFQPIQALQVQYMQLPAPQHTEEGLLQGQGVLLWGSDMVKIK